MNNKKIILLLIFILLLPFIEVLIENIIPKYGGEFNEETFINKEIPGIFFVNRNSNCLDEFEKTSKFSDECYLDVQKFSESIYEIPNRPSKLSLDRKLQESVYKGGSMLNIKEIIVLSANHIRLMRICYAENELTKDGYNLSDSNNYTRYYFSNESKEITKINKPKSSASNYFSNSGESLDYMPDYALNYQVFSSNNNNVLEYEMLAGFIFLADSLIGSMSLQLFEDDCTFHSIGYGKSIKINGYSASKYREDLAYFLRISMDKMEYYERILNKDEVSEDIFYLSYYPEYEKIFLILKIPEEKLENSQIQIDGIKRYYNLIYPTVFVNESGLTDGLHKLDIITQEKTYTINFYVSDVEIYITDYYLGSKQLKFRMKNNYNRDIMITKIVAKNIDANIICEQDFNILVPYNITFIMDKYKSLLSIEPNFNVTCTGLSLYKDQKVKLLTEIHWNFVGETKNHIINGEIFSTVS
jgi:hypothetical protein